MPAFVYPSDWTYYKGTLCPHRAQSPPEAASRGLPDMRSGKRATEYHRYQSEVVRTMHDPQTEETMHSSESSASWVLRTEKGREWARKVSELRQIETGHSGKM